MSQARPLHQCPAFRQASGPTLRPGGLALTARGLDLCAFAPKALVADLGCGPGATLALLEERGLRPLGLDLSAAHLVQARHARPSVRLVQARIQALPLADQSLDGLVCECVLSTLDQPRAALAEMARALRPGGRLLLCDLYLRQPPAGCAVPGCLSGAVPREESEARLLAAGLRPRIFEDHSRSLAQLAGQIVFTHGSLAAFWRLALGRDSGCPDLRSLGYGLILAVKEST